MTKRVRVAVAYVVLLAALLVFGATLVRATIYNPEAESLAVGAPFASSTMPEQVPVRLMIPKLGVAAKVHPLGLTAGNRMQVPPNFSDAGWYKYGVAPGAPGTAVLYGHYNNGLGLDGVFHNIETLVAGDSVQVRTKSGQTLHFVVQSVTAYAYTDVPPEALGEVADDEAHITLITCAGDWIRDPALGLTYDRRLVVRATYREE